MRTIRFTQATGKNQVSDYDSGMCEPSLNLLAHAQAIELEIGSQCGGHGVCGGDRLKIRGDTSALSPVTPAEREHFTSQELQEGWRLACQCFPQNSDLNIQVILPDRI